MTVNTSFWCAAAMSAAFCDNRCALEIRGFVVGYLFLWDGTLCSCFTKFYGTSVSTLRYSATHRKTSTRVHYFGRLFRT
jgi:hypothetical protein